MSWSQGLRPELAPYFEYLVALGARYDPGLRVTSAYRSTSQQAYLYRRYLAGLSAYPAAPPGRSYHEFGRAIDVAARPEILAWMGRVWTSWGGTWGGSSDPIHFQV